MTSTHHEVVSAGSLGGERSRPWRRGGEGVEANARLTGATAAVLFVLLAAEGVTILRLKPLLSWHVFIGTLLIPPVALKIGTTSYRFVRYYRGSPAYRRKGPPPPLLRLLGPFLVVLTVVVLASGVALLLGPPSLRRSLLFLHKASFVLWFGAMAIHVLGHLIDTARLAPRDWVRRSRREVAGAGMRQWVLVSSVGAGALLGLLFLGQATPWQLSPLRHEARNDHARHVQTAHAGETPQSAARKAGIGRPAPTAVPGAGTQVNGGPPPPGQAAAVPQGAATSVHRTAAHRGRRRQGTRSQRPGSKPRSTKKASTT